MLTNITKLPSQRVRICQVIEWGWEEGARASCVGSSHTCNWRGWDERCANVCARRKPRAQVQIPRRFTGTPFEKAQTGLWLGSQGRESQIAGCSPHRLSVHSLMGPLAYRGIFLMYNRSMTTLQMANCSRFESSSDPRCVKRRSRGTSRLRKATRDSKI